MREIGAQQVRACAGGMPRTLLGALLPKQAALAGAAGDRDLVAADDGAVAFLEPPEALVQVGVVGHVPVGELVREPAEGALQPLLHEASHGLLLVPAPGTPAQDEGLLPVGAGEQLDLD